MNLALHIARRYLFAKKSHNAINVISLISVCGVVVATAALVCVLSVFNGFTDVAVRTFSSFDPELKIEPAKGKVFDPSESKIQQIKSLPEIALTSESLEDNALLMYRMRQEPIILKGVSSEFEQLTNIDNLITFGQFMLRDGDIEHAVIGSDLAMLMGIRADFIDPVSIYVPVRDAKVNLANPRSALDYETAFVSGEFTLREAKHDGQMLIVSMGLARKLLRYEKEISSLDIKLKDPKSISAVQQKIEDILGDDFLVKDRFQQQAETYRIVSIEKWVTFLILAIILIVAAFNIVGSLSMLIIEKEGDIQILKNLGANNKLITRIFMLEGFMINFAGATVGLLIGLAISLFQQHFGLWKLGSEPGAFMIDSYPVVVEPLDILLIFVTVNIFGLLAAIYPVNNLRKRLQE